MSKVKTGQYEFLDRQGTFRLERPDNTSYLLKLPTPIGVLNLEKSIL